MGKLHDKPARSGKRTARKTPSGAIRRGDLLILSPNPNPSPEQVARYEALGRYLKERRREAAAMTPAERRQAERDWEKFKRTMNEGRMRKVIVD